MEGAEAVAVLLVWVVHGWASAGFCITSSRPPTQELFRANESTSPVEGTLLGSVKVSANGPSEEVPAVEAGTNAPSPIELPHVPAMEVCWMGAEEVSCSATNSTPQRTLFITLSTFD